MKCPFCNQDDTRVVDSRPADDNSSIRRRRLCDACGKRFTTYEKVETIPLIVIKKDQTRERYDRRKVEDGVMRACYKRPTPIQKIREMLDEVEREIFNREEKELESKVIGEIVMERQSAAHSCSALKRMESSGSVPTTPRMSTKICRQIQRSRFLFPVRNMHGFVCMVRLYLRTTWLSRKVQC